MLLPLVLIEDFQYLPAVNSERRVCPSAGLPGFGTVLLF